MTVAELAKVAHTSLKVMSAYNGKVLCHRFDSNTARIADKRWIGVRSMPDREKLIDLVRFARFDVEGICDERLDCSDCPAAIHEGKCKDGYIADHLIANGVTVQKWIPVTERLPEGDADVIAFCYWHESWQVQVCHLSTNNPGFWYTSIAGQWVPKVTHWMPLPQPPKGE